jgi:hypothetical protein
VVNPDQDFLDSYLFFRWAVDEKESKRPAKKPSEPSVILQTLALATPLGWSKKAQAPATPVSELSTRSSGDYLEGTHRMLLSADELKVLRGMKAAVPIRDRMAKMRTFKRCFVASEVCGKLTIGDHCCSRVG